MRIPIPFAELLRDLLRTNLINVSVAIFLYLFVWNDSFFSELIIAMCIGNVALVLVEIGTVLFDLKKKNRQFFFPYLLLCAALAFVIGLTIAFILLGYPLHSLPLFRVSEVGLPLAISLAISIALAWGFGTRTRIAELKAEAEAQKAHNALVEKQAMQTQLQLLQAQIEPHMLFNTLANVQALIAFDTDKAQHMLDQFILYLRGSLDASRSERTNLAHEFMLIRNYLELMAIRMGHRLQYSLDLPTVLRSLPIAPMLLQPLVENAIKHGLEPKPEGGSLHITAQHANGMLHLAVCDSGLGIDAPPVAYSSKLGNTILQQRIEALYGNVARFELIPNADAGMSAHLYLPIAL